MTVLERIHRFANERAAAPPWSELKRITEYVLTPEEYAAFLRELHPYGPPFDVREVTCCGLKIKEATL